MDVEVAARDGRGTTVDGIKLIGVSETIVAGKRSWALPIAGDTHRSQHPDSANHDGRIGGGALGVRFGGIVFLSVTTSISFEYVSTGSVRPTAAPSAVLYR